MSPGGPNNETIHDPAECKSVRAFVRAECNGLELISWSIPLDSPAQLSFLDRDGAVLTSKAFCGGIDKVRLHPSGSRRPELLKGVSSAPGGGFRALIPSVSSSSSC